MMAFALIRWFITAYYRIPGSRRRPAGAGAVTHGFLRVAQTARLPLACSPGGVSEQCVRHQRGCVFVLRCLAVFVRTRLTVPSEGFFAIAKPPSDSTYATKEAGARHLLFAAHPCSGTIAGRFGPIEAMSEGAVCGTSANAAIPGFSGQGSSASAAAALAVRLWTGKVGMISFPLRAYRRIGALKQR